MEAKLVTPPPFQLGSLLCLTLSGPPNQKMFTINFLTSIVPLVFPSCHGLGLRDTVTRSSHIKFESTKILCLINKVTGNILYAGETEEDEKSTGRQSNEAGIATAKEQSKKIMAVHTYYLD